MNVLIVCAHPRRNSFSAALHDALAKGLSDTGVPFRSLLLADLQFDPDVHVDSPELQPLEPDLERARESIHWADHLVFIYPTWWGTMPALLKGFLDRLLTPNFAFRHHGDGSWDKLLVGRTAHLITTMDTPVLVYRFIYGDPGMKAMARATLGYCGIRTVRRSRLGPVTGSTARQREQWLANMLQEGRRLSDGALTSPQRWLDGAARWLKALRLQFYPMTFIAYWVGALAALAPAQALDLHVFLIGYLVLFLLEVATVLSNDLIDEPSDRLNAQAGPFTGGSRVLVDGDLTPARMKLGIAVALVGCAVACGALWQLAAAPFITLAWLVGLSFCALGYTAAPLKLSYRGLGEIDVALTHSIGVLMLGYLLQGGDLGDALPWTLSLPLGLAILPAILLSGIPDRSADLATGKGTLAVRLGSRRVIVIAALCSLLAIAAAPMVAVPVGHGSVYGVGLYAIFLHGAWLAVKLLALAHRSSLPERLDGMMVLSLTFVLWFGIGPLITLL